MVHPQVEDITQFENIEAAYSIRDALRADEHDGIALDYFADGGPKHVVAFKPDKVIRPQALREVFQGVEVLS